MFERLAELFVVQQLGDVCQRVQVFLKLALRHEKQHYQIHWLIIQRLKIDTLGRTPQRADHFINEIGGSVWDADAESDAGAHRVLAFLHRVNDGLAILGGNRTTGHKLINQFVNRLPAIGGLQRWHDVIGLYYFA